MRTARVPSPSSYQRRRRPGALTSGPLAERTESPLGEDLGGLAHDHQARPQDRVGEASDRVEQGAEIELNRPGKRMQARPHRLVGVLEYPQLGLAAAPQNGRVGPVVDLDRIDQGGLLGRGLCPGQA